MISLQTVDMIVSVVTFFLTYMLSTTFAGAFRAFVAKQMGDDTAADLGFLTLNPIMHIDFIGLVCFIFFGLGWGPHIPIDTRNVQGPGRYFKVFLIFISEVIAYLLMAIGATVALIYSLGKGVIGILVPMIANYELLSHRVVTHTYPTISSLGVVLAFIAITLIYVNAMLATLTIIVDAIRFLMQKYFERFNTLSGYMDIIMIAVPFILLVFLANPLRFLIIKLICMVGYLFGSLICPV